MFEKFDQSHWQKVYSERRRIGLPVAEREVSDHVLLGKRLVHKETGVEYVVRSMKRDFYRGEFLTALMDTDQGSTAYVVVDNLASRCEHIENAALEFSSKYTVLH